MKGAEARLDGKERPGRCVYARKGNTRSAADPVDASAQSDLVCAPRLMIIEDSPIGLIW
jgi:hypothetical protein